MQLRVAGAQIPVTRDVSSNLAEILQAIEFAKAESADILLTPEGSLSGYTPHFDASEVATALGEVTAAAQESGVGLALGTCFLEPGEERPHNQIRFYSAQGEYLGFHSKTLTCGSLTDTPQGEINDYAVSPLRTFQLGEVTLAGLICNDLWANPGCTPGPDPHLTQQLSRMGAQVIFHAVNGGRDGGPWSRQVAWPYHESNLRMRAQAGGLWIVTADNCDPLGIPCSAPSGVVDPKGQWVVKTANTGRDYFVHTIELGDG